MVKVPNLGIKKLRFLECSDLGLYTYLVGDTVRKFTLSSDERENGVPEL